MQANFAAVQCEVDGLQAALDQEAQAAIRLAALDDDLAPLDAALTHGLRQFREPLQRQAVEQPQALQDWNRDRHVVRGVSRGHKPGVDVMHGTCPNPTLTHYRTSASASRSSSASETDPRVDQEAHHDT